MAIFGGVTFVDIEIHAIHPLIFIKFQPVLQILHIAYIGLQNADLQKESPFPGEKMSSSILPALVTKQFAPESFIRFQAEKGLLPKVCEDHLQAFEGSVCSRITVFEQTILSYNYSHDIEDLLLKINQHSSRNSCHDSVGAREFRVKTAFLFWSPKKNTEKWWKMQVFQTLQIWDGVFDMFLFSPKKNEGKTPGFPKTPWDSFNQKSWGVE